MAEPSEPDRPDGESQGEEEDEERVRNTGLTLKKAGKEEQKNKKKIKQIEIEK